MLANLFTNVSASWVISGVRAQTKEDTDGWRCDRAKLFLRGLAPRIIFLNYFLAPRIIFLYHLTGLSLNCISSKIQTTLGASLCPLHGV